MQKVDYYRRTDIPYLLKALDEVEAKHKERFARYSFDYYLCDAIEEAKNKSRLRPFLFDALVRIVQHDLPKGFFIITLERWQEARGYKIRETRKGRYKLRRAWIKKIRRDLKRYYDER